MNKLLTLALCVSISTPGIAQDSTHVTTDSTSKPALYRDPHKARVLGAIFPGAGYVYAGDYLKGYTTWLATVSGIEMGPAVFQMNSCTLAILSVCKPGPQWPFQVVGALMLIAGVYSWAHGAYDAGRVAERANLRHQLIGIRPTAGVMAGSTPRLGAGLNVDF